MSVGDTLQRTAVKMEGGQAARGHCRSGGREARRLSTFARRASPQLSIFPRRAAQLSSFVAGRRDRRWPSAAVDRDRIGRRVVESTRSSDVARRSSSQYSARCTRRAAQRVSTFERGRSTAIVRPCHVPQRRCPPARSHLRCRAASPTRRHRTARFAERSTAAMADIFLSALPLDWFRSDHGTK